MLNLDILRKKFAAISPLEITPCDEARQVPQDILRHYTDKLEVREGQAAHIVTDEFLFFGKIVQKDTGAVLLVGPATEYALAQEAKKRIASALGLRRNQAAGLHDRLSRIPIMQLTAFIQQLSFLNYIINGDETVQSNFSEQAIALKSYRPSDQYRYVNHNTEEFEARMLSCIEHGKLDALEALLETAALNQHTTGIISVDAIQAQKNILVTSTALSCRAAVRGGLDYNLAMSISDHYLQQVEGIYSFDTFHQLWRKMLMDFTARTANLQLHADCSDLVRTAAQQISGQLYRKISIEQLARKLNVSRSYLSHQFKRETGRSLTDYIMQQKVNEAIRLLQATDMPLAQIAYQLAFSSQSYFNTVFKRITGISPGKYPRNG
jgi:AraC-like DNA-binding protein